VAWRFAGEKGCLARLRPWLGTGSCYQVPAALQSMDASLVDDQEVQEVVFAAS
jgi:hypothetical protein